MHKSQRHERHALENHSQQNKNSYKTIHLMSSACQHLVLHCSTESSRFEPSKLPLVPDVLNHFLLITASMHNLSVTFKLLLWVYSTLLLLVLCMHPFVGLILWLYLCSFTFQRSTRRAELWLSLGCKSGHCTVNVPSVLVSAALQDSVNYTLLPNRWWFLFNSIINIVYIEFSTGLQGNQFVQMLNMNWPV